MIARNVAPEKRSWAMGVAAAAGSFGQFLMVPVEGWLISAFGWQEALLFLGAAVLLIMPLALFLREPGFVGGVAPKREQTIVQALREALRARVRVKQANGAVSLNLPQDLSRSDVTSAERLVP